MNNRKMRPGGVQAAPFSPLSIAGLALWLDAGISSKWQDTGRTTPATADDATVRVWDDLSGNGKHAVAPSDAARPLLKLAVQNSLPTLLFDGVNDTLITPAFGAALTQPLTQIVVATSLTLDAFVSAITDGASARASILADYFGNNTFTLAATSGAGSNLNRDTNIHCLTAVFNGASSVFRGDGVAKTLGGNPGTDGLDLMCLASNAAAGGSSYHNCRIFAVLVYAGAVSAGNIALLEAYFNQRYALGF